MPEFHVFAESADDELHCERCGNTREEAVHFAVRRLLPGMPVVYLGRSSLLREASHALQLSGYDRLAAALLLLDPANARQSRCEDFGIVTGCSPANGNYSRDPIA